MRYPFCAVDIHGCARETCVYEYGMVLLVLEEYFFSNTVAERASRFWTGYMGWVHSESGASQAFWRQRAIDVAMAFDEFVLL